MTVVRFDRGQHLGHIVLCDPPFNWISSAFRDDLRQAVSQAAASDIRALLIRADGPNFSAGGAVHEWPNKSFQWFSTFINEVVHSYRAIEALPIPVVAAVRGELTGGGQELVLAADFIIASQSAVFWSPEIIGAQIPLAGAVQRLARLVGPAKMRRMVMLGQKMPVTDIPEVADFIVADEQLDQFALEFATRLANGPTPAYAAAKALLKASTTDLAAADRHMAALTLSLYATEDAQRLIQAAAPMYAMRAAGMLPPGADGPPPFAFTYSGR